DARVRKHGRTTGLTEGIITDELVDALVGMDHADNSVFALFENQIRIETAAPQGIFARAGDSGSLVINQDAHAVGLYFAGPPAGDYGYANHIGEVESALEIE